MKLKKIVSLALAGILAVSMLTACDSKGGSSSEPTEPVDTSIATVLNDAQADNEVKADFTYSNDAEKAVEKALAAYGSDAEVKDVKTVVTDALNVSSVKSVVALYEYNTTERTYVYVLKDQSSMTDEALMKSVASKIDFASLQSEAKNGGIKYSFNNEGTVAMVKSETINGNVNRYVVVTITCTTTSAVDQ
ncbi:hypothetical protein B5G28_02120 [Faecalibacterium sp. An77]|uniref:hypothetical protein n=1 Tax=Faecalibacterium sp. An77 TaxID=1965655 RepID=UPI000B366A18|nr:hypothetical protein [Faecalibacterium sp. An77]OUN40178.1 hypothetical protein B5G28_02120 [Faecalibacterium sp. An77]